MTHDHDLVLRPTEAQTRAALNPPPGRNGGDLVVETLQGLGATTVFGLPGQHALGMFDALRRSSLRYVGLRVENNAGFAADAYGRITGEAAPLLLDLLWPDEDESVTSARLSVALSTVRSVLDPVGDVEADREGGLEAPPRRRFDVHLSLLGGR